MKRVLPVYALYSAAALLGAVSAQAQLSGPELLSRAQTEYARGQLDAAKRDFEAVLRIDPKNVTATAFLAQIRTRDPRPGNAIEAQLSKLIVPKVELNEATLDSVLEYLKRTAAKLSNDQVKLSIVPQIPEETLHNAKVTLSLQDVPMTEVLRYVGNLAGVRFTFDPYAIVVKPAATATAVVGGGDKQ